MRRLYIGLAVLVIVVAVAIVVLMSRREKPLHAGKGMVTSVDVGGGRVTMKDEARGNLVLVLSQDTKVTDDEGNPIPATKLKAGDLIRQECVLVDSSRCQARQIRVLRPAEKELASPEQ